MKTKVIYPTKLQRSWTFLVISFLFSLQTFAQAPNWLWAKGIGGTGFDGDKGFATAVDASGNVYTTGSFSDSVDFDPGPGTFFLNSNGIGGGGMAMFISKLDVSGNFVWAKAMATPTSPGGAVANSIVLDASGNIYTTGEFSGTVDFDPGPGAFNLITPGNAYIFISKLNSSGNFVWARAMGTPAGGGGEGLSLAVDASASVYTTGNFGGVVDFDPGAGIFNLTSVGSNFFISKLDASGNFVWAKTNGGTGGISGQSIALDASGNVYTTGSFDDTVDFDPGAGIFNLMEVGGGDIYVLKLNNSGNFVWAKQMGGPQGGSSSAEGGLSITTDASGNVYTTGNFGGDAGDMSDFDPGPGTYNLSTAGSADVFISKLNSSGNFVWAKSIGGLGAEVGFDIALDPSGNIYTTGIFQATADFDPGVATFNLTFSGGFDIFISKLNSSGNFVWAKGSGGTGMDIGYSLSVTSSGFVYVTGTFESSSIAFDSVVLTNADSIGFTEDIFIAKLNNIVGIDELTDEDAFQIYPSPTSGQLSVITEHLSGKTEIEFYNTLGEKIYEQKIISLETEINLSGQPGGVYFLKIKSANNSITQKLIIQK